jgi:DNA-binding MarR family transcriptional regulator
MILAIMIKGTEKPCVLSQKGSVPLEHQLTELFWILGPAFTRWAESHMHERGLTAQRVRLLGLLLKNGSMKMSRIKDELGVTATNVTALVDALEKDDLVARKPHPTDRRATMIELTVKAQKSLTENCTEFKNHVSEIFSVFTVAEKEIFVSYLTRMKGALVGHHILEESEYKTKNKGSHEN